MKLKSKLLLCLFSVMSLPTMAADIDLIKIAEDALILSQKGVRNHQECVAVANQQYQMLFDLPIQQVKLDAYTTSQLETVVRQSFQARLNVRKHMNNYNSSAPYAADCLKAVRDVTRAHRYMEDYIVLHLEKNKIVTYRTLTGQGAYFLKTRSDFKDYRDLQSGDIIISRGNAYSSAAIARIGTADAQFSHISFVYKDEKGQLHTTEAHIEIGSVVAPIQKHLDQANSRSAVFRYHDQELAHQASKAIYEKVKRHSATYKENIFYDFSMDLSDNRSLFCSEVVYDGFNMASKGQVQVPMHLSQFPAGLVPFLRLIGLKVDKERVKTFKTFAPADLEFDPRFELIAEYRMPSKIRDSHKKDAILTKMLEWMEKGYSLRPTKGMNLKSIVAWVGRRLPWVKNSLKERLPVNMKRSQLKVFLVLDKVGDNILKRIDQHEQKLGREMSFKETFIYLENLREHDEQLWRSYKPSTFHYFFHK